MPEADVLYSDVKFKKSRDKVSASPTEDTTYSEVKIANTSKPSTELTDPKQAGANSRSGVTSERLALIVLTVLLVAAVTALGYTTYKDMQTNENLQTLRSENEMMRKNLTAEGTSGTRPCITLKPTCWASDTCQKCGAGWEQFGGTCYHFSVSRFSWSQSRTQCKHKKGDLVKIDSRDEQIFLDEKLRPKMEKAEDKFWIGLTDSEEEGTWLWVDDSPLNQSLTFWSGEEPDNWKNDDTIEEDCGRMGERGGAEDHKSWFDRSCEDKNRYICEKQATDGKHQCV